MKLKILTILFAFVALALGGKVQDLDKLSDEEYSRRALEELKYMSQSRSITAIQSPYCKIYEDEDAAECYLKFKWMQIPRVLAVRVEFDTKALSLAFGLYFDDDLLFDYRFDIAKICVPLPARLKFLDICFHTYYVDIDTQPPALSFDVCFLLTLADIFHLQLNCIRMDKNGKFLHHAEHKPEDEGIITLSIEDGNLKFKLNNPIPKEIMDEIEKQWKQFENETVNAMINTGREFEKFGKDIEKTFDKFGKDVEKFGKDVEKEFNKFGKDTEKEFGKVGKDLDKFGKDAEVELNKFGNDTEKEFNKFGKNTEKEFDKVGKELDKFGKDAEKELKKFGKDAEKAFNNIGNAFINFFG